MEGEATEMDAWVVQDQDGVLLSPDLSVGGEMQRALRERREPVLD